MIINQTVSGGGSTPVIDTLNVTPTTSAQQITAPQGTDGYSPVNVSAVTSSIDNNIQAGNIKNGVTILGVTGNYTGGGVDTTGWIPKAIDANGKLVGSSTMPNFAGVKDLTDNILQYGFYGNTALTGALSFPSLTTISGQSAMNNAFYGCTGLTSVSFPALTTLTGGSGMNTSFMNCTGLTSVSFPALTTLTASSGMAYSFRGCTGLTSVSFPALKSDSFGTFKNIFNNMLQGVTGCTIHFPSNLDPQTGSTVISSLSGYPNFGGTNTVLAFDLPATE